ncbi:MAG TPA: DUF2461 domain-containing protein [Kineosporiaceae bacterium]|nr:DUF2461 domain-containing protein [Kineosporiaceae bacterium]
MTSGANPTGDLVPAFDGFPDEALLFYEGLEADNSKSYWTDQRDRYERAVRGPMLTLLAELEPEFGPGKLFRPYRDIRFSADKTPYKTHAGAVVGTGDAAGALYVQLSAEGLLLGGGYYRMSADQLSRYRESVTADRPGTRLAAEVEKLRAAGWSLAGDRLSRAPRGYPQDHPRAGLLTYKGIAAMRQVGTPDWLGTPRCRGEVAAGWRQLAGLTGWLAEHVGPAEPTEGDPRSARAARLTGE